MSLEPIDPETVLELYLADKEHDLAEASAVAQVPTPALRPVMRSGGHQEPQHAHGTQAARVHLWRRFACANTRGSESGDAALAMTEQCHHQLMKVG